MNVDLQFLLQMIFGVVTFLGGFIMKGQSDSIKDLQAANARLSDRLQDYVLKDEFREFRAEQRENFRQLFEKVDAVKEQIAEKADRHEVTR
ncbi:hypothetical protein [Bordetella phage vB_BbrM_PHB04]|uniref:Uncharacterized protein n=1 Tax=Bordetella phage vB_BbrM_PHB04 TaxID=2029657 RepID=A0A291LA79_9CAUD|nr:hypothetical protein HOS14_gp116 [Bordetella phage vB_BbrM_PHB04]ATI15734.1 hypothetical protein [Bordetella phage vB_BbrM_PHB04]